MFAVAGDVHGAISFFYEKVAEVAKKIGKEIDFIIQIGDLQVYSKKSKVDGAVIRHGGPGEIPEWIEARKGAPIPTYAIHGNHDDGEIFYRYWGSEIVPNLFLLKPASVKELNGSNGAITVASLGGNFSPVIFEKDIDTVYGRKKKHYTRAQWESLLTAQDIDILLTHEAPTEFVNRGRQDLGRPEIRELIEKMQPKMAFFGHHHRYYSGQIGRTQVIGLAKIQFPGSILCFDWDENGALVRVGDNCQRS